jgi:hypothetical protein
MPHVGATGIEEEEDDDDDDDADKKHKETIMAYFNKSLSQHFARGLKKDFRKRWLGYV